MLFENCIFKKRADFHSSKIANGIYFTGSYFYDYADFHSCEFEKITCFYRAKFEKAPNFSACYFKEQKAVNLINADIDKLNFKSVENYIKDNYKDEKYKDEINKDEINKDEKSIFKIENKYKLKCAKDCKDSFRVIKDVLTNQNNTLEAQEWHKLELYAKEKELLFEVENCHSKNNMRLVAIKSQDKNSINLTVDLLLLCIYRITSLHHTSFTRIINFTSWNIAIFGILIYLMSLLSLSFDEKSIFWFWGIFIFIIMSTVIVWKVFERKKLYAASLISYTFVIFLVSIYLVINMTKLSSFWYITFAALAYCFFVIILCYFYSCIETKPKLFYWLNGIVYIILISIIIVKPQLINPFMGVFSSDKIYESQLEKKLNDFNTSAILNLAKISQKDFNLSMDYKDISFTELNSAKKIIIDNKENLKEILSSIYNKEHKENYKRVLQELENNASNLKNIIQQIDKKNNNSFISARLYEFLKSNFGKFNDLLYLIKSNFSFIAKKLTPQKLANFDKKDNQEKLKNILSLLKFEQKFEEVAQTINQDKIMQEALKSTSILYSIILLLCVFSLQKTARKNSIVPS
ncbi:pentapeptide repeat-containing protein [Campylobacter taeniopygiae]|uniref:pentapeptide repeat-containing protein n=1 Tax=Campylobacter taeniopygiae TaxID=2510188 RepID=UPI003D6B2A26